MVATDLKDFTDASARKLTPMLRQYLEAKEACPGAILLFRMGDFFELFFDDAVTAARELDLTLTSRDKDSTDPIPMAGVPHHAIDSYIHRLVHKGFTVAICDQLEDPKQAKGIVKRGITRLVTPGTATDLEALDPGATSYLSYVGLQAGQAQVAFLDLLAGELLCADLDQAALADELLRMGVREVLCDAKDHPALTTLLGPRNVPLRALEDAAPTPDETHAFLLERLGTDQVSGFPVDVSQAHGTGLVRLLRFAESTQRRPLVHVMAPVAYRPNDFVVLDEATRKNLELVTTTQKNERKGSLVWHLDRCKTAMGSRLLLQWLLYPLKSRAKIDARLDVVSAWKIDREARQAVQKAFQEVRDLERLVGRVAVGRATPRDLAALRETLLALPKVQGLVREHASSLGGRWAELDIVQDLAELLASALVDEPPVLAADGGIFKRGYKADLDELLSLSQDGHDFLADLETRERARTGISNLKVRYNRVFGYYIEITRAHLGNVPPDFVRKQTLVGAERFITDELKQYEDKVLNADARKKAREIELFDELLAEVGRGTARLRAVSRLVAETDVFLALGEVADEGRYERPELCDEPVLELSQSRHPVIERLLPGGERFVPNDVSLDAASRQLLVMTGPNMAGKSTVMRQVALTAILAHMGAFVPAKKARVGVCDRVFTRVGASDNLGRGHSTFMVEMIETATILLEATKDSLVLLDEIGRGTSTFDGVSIAWAVAEHLHDIVQCRAMFATHYHELTDLALERPRIVNVSVAVKEHNERIVFLRQLVDGAANRSYGIQVARLAGLPEPVLLRAREILGNLEAGELDESGMPALSRSAARKKQQTAQLNLFARPVPKETVVKEATEPKPDPALVQKLAQLEKLAGELMALDPMNMTPMQALAAIERLRSQSPS